jgi:segregation and condensation protein B
VAHEEESESGAMGEPSTGEPDTSELDTDQPVTDQPVTDQPDADEPDAADADTESQTGSRVGREDRPERESGPDPEDHALKDAAEAIIFAADEPVPPHRIAEIFAEITGRVQPDIEEVEEAVRDLSDDYAEAGRVIEIHEWAGGYRMTTSAPVSPFVKALHVGEQETSLSRSLLETLAVLAYRQPVTRPEVDFVRGVNSDYAIRKLLDLGLADVKGRSDSLGRPLLYGTTNRFLEQFGLNSLEDLPTLREIEDLLDDPNFDRERSELLKLQTEEEITSEEKAKEVLEEAREKVQKGELDVEGTFTTEEDERSDGATAADNEDAAEDTSAPEDTGGPEDTGAPEEAGTTDDTDR